MTDRAYPDQNNNFSLFAVSNTDGATPVSLWADPVTHLLQVSSGGSGGGGTQYQELATTTPATGTLALGRYQTSLPTLTNGQMNEPMLDATSTLLVNSSTLATAANQASMLSNQTNGNQLVKLTNGTNVADVVAGDTGFNGVATASATKTYTFTTSSSGAQTILANTPTEGFSWIEVVYTSVGSGLALAGQFSTTSGGAYVSVNSFQGAGGGTGPTTLGATVSTIYTSEIHGQYFQIAVSALTSGTFTGTVTLRSTPYIPENIRITQSGTITVGSNSATGSAVPANAFYIAGINGSTLTGATVNFPSDAYGANNGLQTQDINLVYNGTNFDRQRSATAASNTTGTGLLGVGPLMFDGTNWQPSKSVASGMSDGTTGSALLATGVGYYYNTASYDRARNNITGVVVAAGQTSTTTQTVTTYNASKLLIQLNIASGSGSVTIAINGVTSSGSLYNIATSSALSGVGGYQCRVFPGATASAGSTTVGPTANDMVPRNLSITYTVSGTVSFGSDYELSV